MDKEGEGNSEPKKSLDEVLEDDSPIKKKYLKAFDHLTHNAVK
jgi:hypothetical protein